MASLQQLKSGKFRACIHVNGVRESKAFTSLKRAKSWARDREAELNRDSGYIMDSARTVGDLFARYAEEVSSEKRGSRWELIRLTMLIKSYPTLCSTKLLKRQREDIEAWIEQRLERVKPSSVNRELNLISHTLTQARRWRWIAHNPMKDLKRPKNPPARFRRIEEHEIKEICDVLGYAENQPPTTKKELTALAFLFAIETAMRAGEICSLKRENIDLDNCVAYLSLTKNGDSRQVPLSDRAIELLRKLPTPEDTNKPIFGLSSQVLSTMFRKYRDQTSIKDLTFHDTRHEATTRLADKLHVLELASVTGHKNLNELMTYYNKSASDLAGKLRSAGKKPVTRLAEAQENSDMDYSQVAKALLKQLAKEGGSIQF